MGTSPNATNLKVAEPDLVLPQNPANLRRRRNASRRRRPPVGESRGKPTAARAAHLARSLAAVAAQDSDTNLDLECQVHGVTHRGTLKLKVLKVESLSADMVDVWRTVCAEHGYAADVTFSTVTSEVDIVCTPLPPKSTWGHLCQGMCGSWRRNTVLGMHPLTAASLVLTVADILRHTAF